MQISHKLCIAPLQKQKSTREQHHSSELTEIIHTTQSLIWSSLLPLPPSFLPTETKALSHVFPLTPCLTWYGLALGQTGLMFVAVLLPHLPSTGIIDVRHHTPFPSQRHKDTCVDVAYAHVCALLCTEATGGHQVSSRIMLGRQPASPSDLPISSLSVCNA